jgi:TPP-dependent 2-oxoacid decarboxylase
VIAETGDSWFNGVKLSLPEGARFEIQMQYGSIGWSVGATLGYALGSPRHLIALIGDGSFQMAAQEVSTMIRYGLKPIIFLINNGGYTIEVEIHDGPYNVIKNWDYAGLVDVFNAGEGKGRGTRVATQNQLDAAIAQALDHDGLSLIEVIIDRDDCSKDLLEWGRHVATNSGRPPRTP